MTKKGIITLLSVLWVLMPFSYASASQLVYTPVNPDFGGNPANAAGLMNEANANNHYTAPATSAVSASNLLEESIISSASSQITNKIFNSTPGQGGTYQLGNGGSITYANNGNIITVTIVDGSGTTTFTIPGGM